MKMLFKYIVRCSGCHGAVVGQATRSDYAERAALRHSDLYGQIFGEYDHATTVKIRKTETRETEEDLR